jgi:hypothetical protein
LSTLLLSAVNEPMSYPWKLISSLVTESVVVFARGSCKESGLDFTLRNVSDSLRITDYPSLVTESVVCVSFLVLNQIISAGNVLAHYCNGQ